MFVVWGTKTANRRRGYVAEFCPICRSIQPCRVLDLNRVKHLYMISVGQVEHVQQEVTCTGCRRRTLVGPFTYQAFVRDRNADINRLVRETHPHLLEEIADRLVLEERARGTGQPLSRDERMGLLAEPFHAMSHAFDRNLGPYGGLERLTGLSLLATFLSLFASIAAVFAIVLGEKGPGSPLSKVAIALGVAFGLSLAGTIYAVATQDRRIARRRIVPFLVRALAPLQPTRAELADVVVRLRDRGLLIGEKLDTQWIVEAMAAAEMRMHEPPRPMKEWRGKKSV